MISPSKPGNEQQRLESLYSYDILDSLTEKEYDDITRIAADICGVPMSLITLIDKDRQWFKAGVGLDLGETSRDTAFCAHAILNPSELMIVPDSSKDERFADNPYVTGDPHVNFYAGVPLVNPGGFALGTLCVLDQKPNQLSPEQKTTLQALARQVVMLFELRKSNKQLEEQANALEQINSDLARFAHVVAHDMKSPCSSIAMASNYLKDSYNDKLDETGTEMINLLDATSHKVVQMIDGILHHTLTVNAGNADKTEFTFSQIMAEVKGLLKMPAGFSLTIENGNTAIKASQSMLQQVLLNLCSNAIKYNDKKHGEVIVSVAEDNKYYTFSVKDNGPGINLKDRERIFDLFSTLGKPDRNNQMGTGIGLATVQRLVQKMEGTINLVSEVGKGSNFIFTVAK